MTITFVGSIAARLIEASRTNDFSTSKFHYLDGWLQRTLDQFDRLVHCSYTSWANFDLWNAWFRVWALGNILGSLGPITLYIRSQAQNNPNLLAEADKPPYRGLAAIDLEEYAHLFNSSAETMESFRAGKITAEQATAQIFKYLSECPLAPPQVKLADPEARSLECWSVWKMLRVYIWGRWLGPKKMHKLYFDASIFTYPAQTWRDMWIEIKKAFRTAWATVRDVNSPFNLDWKNKRYDKVTSAKPLVMLPEQLYRDLDVPYESMMKKEPAMSRPEAQQSARQ
jgi:FADH2 O2-dependent halogenase